MRAVSPGRRRRDGIVSHDLAYIPIYAEHVQCGKVDGKAMPVIETPTALMIRIDAATGFTHPAIDAGFEKLIPLARTNGITGMSIHNSCNCGVLGYHTERLAEVGLVGIGFTNAPASIAPSGGSRPVVGTNPFSIAVSDGQCKYHDRPVRQRHRQERGVKARARGQADPRRLGAGAGRQPDHGSGRRPERLHCAERQVQGRQLRPDDRGDGRRAGRAWSRCAI